MQVYSLRLTADNAEPQKKARHSEKEQISVYLTGFIFEESEAFWLVKGMCIRKDGSPVKKVKLPMLKSLIACILFFEAKNGRAIIRDRVTIRCIATNYKFIQENIELFKKYRDSGTRLIVWY